MSNDGPSQAPAGEPANGVTPPSITSPAGEQPGRRRRAGGRAARIAVTLVAVLAVLVVALAAALYWAGTESGLRFVLARLQGPLRDAAQELVVESPSGSLWSELRIPRLTWRSGGTAVSGEDLLLRWTPRALLQRRLHVAELSARRLAVQLPPPAADAVQAGPPTMPGPLVLPGTARVDRLAIGSLELTPGAAPETSPAPAAIVIRDLAAGAGYADGRFRVDDLTATSQWGRVAGATASFGDTAPHPLQLDARIEGEVERIAYAVAVAARGDLERASASVEGRAAQADVRLAADLTPLGASPLQAARAAVDGLDLATLPIGSGSEGGVALPSTRLALVAEVSPRAADGAAGAGWRGRVSLRNPPAGSLSDGRLPVAALDTAFDWLAASDPAEQRLQLDELRVAMPGPAGRQSPDAEASISGGLTLHPNRKLRVAGIELPTVLTGLAFERIDLSRFAAQLPPTALDGRLDLDERRFSLALAQSAAQMRALLPAAAAQPAEIVARGRLDEAMLALDEARIRLGQSSLTATGQVGAEAPHRVRLNGELQRVELAQWLPADLATDPRLRDGRINASWSVDGSVLPGFDGAVALKVADSALGGEPLTADIRTRLRLDQGWLPQQVAQTNVDLRLGASRVQARGALGQPAETLTIDADLPALARLDARLAGRAKATAELAGGFDRLRARVTASGDELRLRQDGGDLRVASVRLEASGPLTATPAAQAPLSATARLRNLQAAGRMVDAIDLAAGGTIGTHRFDLSVAAEGNKLSLGGDGTATLQGSPSWRARLATVSLDGPVPARLRGPAELRVDAQTVRLERFDLAIAGGQARLDRLNLHTGDTPQFEARGGLRSLPVMRLLQIAGVDRGGLEPLSALLLESDWDLRGTGIGDLSGTARLDLREEATADAAAGRALGLRGDNGLDVKLNRGRLDGRIDLELPSLEFSRPLTAPDLVIDGRAKLAGTIGGTLERPLYDLRLDGERMAVLQRAMGWRLTDGEIAARFSGRTFELQRLRFASGDGAVELQGKANLLDAPRPGAEVPDAAGADRRGARTGNAARKAPDKPSTLPLDGAFDLTAKHFVVPIGPGQRVALSGNTRLTSDATGLALRGKLSVDQGIIEIQGSSAPALPDDVRIVGAEGKTVADSKAAKETDDGQAASAVRILTDLGIDLGKQLRVTGNGVFAKLTGNLQVSGLLPEQPLLSGQVNVTEGSYQAYGQNLQIRRGAVRFNGPIDNPTLDIRAVRPLLPVEVGVEVTGTALDPTITLFSTPEMADTDKLSWLVLGVDPKQAPSAAQSLALQQAAKALLLRDDGSHKPGVAERLGLDVVNFGYGSTTGMQEAVKETMSPATGLPGASTSSTASAAQREVVTLGKRIGSRLFVSYEQGVRGVWNLLRIQYTLTRRLSVRAQSGSDTALDLLYSFSFD